MHNQIKQRILDVNMRLPFLAYLAQTAPNIINLYLNGEIELSQQTIAKISDIISCYEKSCPEWVNRKQQ